jgi:hypothetical protein
MTNIISGRQIIQAFLTTLFLFILLSLHSLAQTKPAVTVFTRKQRGVGFVTSDSVFSLNFQFRIQNRAMYISKTDTDLAPESFELRSPRVKTGIQIFQITDLLIPDGLSFYHSVILQMRMIIRKVILSVKEN